jgi:hypothetical protein
MLEQLVIPKQVAKSKDIFDTRPRAVQQWISDLPMVNLGETSRLLFKTLIDTNRMQINADERLQMLEQFREPLNYVSDSLNKHFISTAFPLPTKNRKIAKLAREIEAEMALGYKIILRTLVNSTKKADLKLMGPALHLAITYLGRVLLKSYQVYAPYPKNLWYELHQLYAFAEEQKLLKEAHSPLDAEHFMAANVETAYKQILLMTLSSPYRFRQQDITNIFSALSTLADSADIISLVDPENPQGLFVFNLDSDTCPTYFTLYKEKDFRNCRLLDTSELAHKIHQQIVYLASDEAKKKQESPLQHIPEGVLKQLVNSWTALQKRSFSRTQKSAHVEAVLGISASHHFISGEVAFAPENMSGDQETEESTDNMGLSSVATYTSSKVNDVNELKKGPDIWEMNYTYVEKNDSRNNPQQTNLNSTTAINPNLNYLIHDLDMLNVSAGGYCLLCQDNCSCIANVGDLIAIREHINQSINQWGIGVIRRMKMTGQDHLEVGVQMLTPNAVATAARIVHPDGKKGEYMRSLMLPELRAINQPATLITPNLPFKVGSDVDLNMNNRSMRITLVRRLESTGSFTQYEFTGSVNTDSLTDENEDKNQEQDYESVWSSL